MVGYRDDHDAHRRGDARRLLPHRRRREPGRGRLHHLRRAQRRRVQGQRLPDLPVRAGERADRAPGGRRGGGRAGAGPGAAGGAQGVRRAGRGSRARRRRPRESILRYVARAPGAVQADPPAGVRRAAEDDQRQDPPGRAAHRRERARTGGPRTSSARRTSPTSRADRAGHQDRLRPVGSTRRSPSRRVRRTSQTICTAGLAGWAACTSRCSTTSWTTTSTAAASSATSTSAWPGPPTSAASWRWRAPSPTRPTRRCWSGRPRTAPSSRRSPRPTRTC